MTREPFIFNCKACGVERLTYWTPNEMFTIEKWKSWLCCDPCADYRKHDRMLTDKIVRLCTRLHTARTFDSAELNDVESAVRIKLDDLTKRLANLTCNHYGFAPLWEEDFVTQLTDSPDKAWTVLRVYRQGIERQAKTKKAA